MSTRKKKSSKSSAQTKILCPNNLSFLWKIQPIDTDAEAPPRYHGVGSGKGNDVFKIKFPQNRHKFFTRRNGNVFRWLNGVSYLLEDPPRLKDKERLEIASVFFLPRLDNFVVSIRDCTREDISEGDVGWAQIMFNKVAPGLSYVEPAAAANFHLLAPADGTTWMPQVLPAVYNYPSDRPYDGPSGGLCGKLSVLIGMAAFSADEAHAEEVVQSSFGWQQWVASHTQIGVGRM
jgi:hypothetical protein